jgi:cell division protein FtsL
MIARPLPQLEEFVARGSGSRAGRTAAALRRGRTRRRRYETTLRIVATVGVLTMAVVFYLGLAANVMRLNYELGKMVRERSRLVDETQRLDDQIAQLQSRDRLAAVAASLGMRQADTFVAVVVPLPERPAPPRRLAFLNWPR